MCVGPVGGVCVVCMCASRPCVCVCSSGGSRGNGIGKQEACNQDKLGRFWGMKKKTLLNSEF